MAMFFLKLRVQPKHKWISGAVYINLVKYWYLHNRNSGKTEFLFYLYNIFDYFAYDITEGDKYRLLISIGGNICVR